MTYFQMIEKVDAQDPAAKADLIFQENMKKYDKTVVSTVVAISYERGQGELGSN